MRTSLPVVLACLALASAIGGWLIAGAAASAGNASKAPPTASAPVPAAAQKPAAAPAANSSIDSDAPARHARRTACLKDAKAKKLVGAQRSSYVKNCMGAS
jgi:hypothetical protein